MEKDRKNKGRLMLIPSPIGDNDPSEVIPGAVLEAVRKIKVFVVEDTRTVRRYLSRAGLKGHIEDLEFHELNEHTRPEEIEAFISLFDNGTDVGLVSEAGLPAVADPGAQLVDLAHRHGIQVVPFVGPSSLMLALMASGMNGQSFSFLGYLPVKADERKSRLKAIEKQSAATGQTQIFIETPYRNDSMMKDILACCHDDTKICVAAGLTSPDAFIRTLKVHEWKKAGAAIGKRPCVFLLLA